MGANNSKKNVNQELKQIGDEANKKDPDTFEVKGNNILTFINDLKSITSSSNPEKDYDIIKVLKKGKLSDTYLVQNKVTENKCLMKTIKKSQKISEKMSKFLFNDIEILASLDHPNIVNVFGFYSNETSYSYITEYCKNGDLYNEIMNNGPYEEKIVAYIMHQILSAVKYFHGKKIINRNLSLDNILISDKKQQKNLFLPTVKINHFNIAIKEQEENEVQNQKMIFSLFNAPEVIKKNYNQKCDLWSCGVIMYFLLSGRPPFGGENNEEISNKILKGSYDLTFAPFDKLSKACKDLLEKLLETNVNKRLDASQALEHQWFEDNHSKMLFYEISDENTVTKLIENLKDYKNKSTLQKISMTFLIHNYPQMKDVINASKLFNKIDKDNDCKISKEELYNGLKIKYNTIVKKEDIEEIFLNLDINNNGYIDYIEFVSAAVNKTKFVNKNTLSMAFKYFDKDNSGEITLDEIEKMFKESQNNTNVETTEKDKIREALENVMKEADLNIDGKITFDEFVIMMKKLI